MTDLVTHTHLRELGYCNRGTKAFFVRHGLDWDKFRKAGLPPEDFLKTGDAMAARLVEHAHGR